MLRLICALALIANDLLFTALNAVFVGGVFYVLFSRFVVGCVVGAALFLAIILVERLRSGRWWWNVGRFA